MNNRILVVDDEIDVMTLFQQRFRREVRNGVLAFKFVKSGREAMDILHEDEPVPTANYIRTYEWCRPPR